MYFTTIKTTYIKEMFNITLGAFYLIPRKRQGFVTFIQLITWG